MKMKTVMIHYHDGAKQRIKVSEEAKYIEILPNSGAIYEHYNWPPRMDFTPFYDCGVFTGVRCLPGHAPQDDGMNKSILLKIEEV